MLTEALLVAHKHQLLREKTAAFEADLKKLPIEELKQIVETGQIKLAFLDACDGPGGKSVPWVEHFKGTPFFEQAIGLEQEELQAMMAQQQQRSVESQKNQQQWDAMDQIRLRKRLLELQKARNEAQVLSGGGGPPNQTGSGAGAEAQGAGALGPVAPEGQQEGSGDAHKMAAALRKVATHPAVSIGHHVGKRTAPVFGALGAAAGAIDGHRGKKKIEQAAKKHPDNKILQFAAKHPKTFGAAVGGVLNATTAYGGAHVGAQLGHSIMKHSSALPMADEWGRQMARADMAKIARAQGVLSTGDMLGRMMAKEGGGLEAVGKWALEHPHHAGAIAGGALGAAHGLMKEDGGLASAVGEGVMGAGLGHAAGGIAGGMRSLEGTAGEKLMGSAKMYGAHVKNQVTGMSDKIKGALKEAPAPESSVGHVTQKTEPMAAT